MGLRKLGVLFVTLQSVSCFLIPHVQGILMPSNENAPMLFEAEDEHYVILTDEELVQNADILQHLTLATKEEIEEIVADNPSVQQMMLNKIKKIVSLKEASIGHDIYNHQNKLHHQVVASDFDGSQDADGDLDELLPADKLKFDLLKTKLKNKAAKLFKIGSNLKGKLVALKGAKSRKKKFRPKIHIDVSTVKDKGF